MKPYLSSAEGTNKMLIDHVNWLAVVAAALATFALGGLWYSLALFGRAWMAENNLPEEELHKGKMIKIFGLSFILSLLMSANLAMFLAKPKTTASWEAIAGLLAGFGWVALSIAIVVLFERRSWKYVLINGGYMTVAFVLMGLILGAWRREVPRDTRVGAHLRLKSAKASRADGNGFSG